MSLQWIASSAENSQARNIEPASETTIAEVAEALHQIRHTSTMKLTLDIGSLVVNRIFDGDLERVRSHGRKDTSFRRLAAYPNLPFSAMRIWRAVGVFDLVSRMPGVANHPHLSVSHLYTVLGLPHQTQEWLLRATVEQRWAVTTLDQKARKHRAATSRGPRTARPVILTSLQRVERITEGLSNAAGNELDGEQLRSAMESLRKIRCLIEELTKALAAPSTPAETDSHLA